jgi:hypothetical protein
VEMVALEPSHDTTSDDASLNSVSASVGGDTLRSRNDAPSDTASINTVTASIGGDTLRARDDAPSDTASINTVAASVGGNTLAASSSSATPRSRFSVTRKPTASASQPSTSNVAQQPPRAEPVLPPPAYVPIQAPAQVPAQQQPADVENAARARALARARAHAGRRDRQARLFWVVTMCAMIGVTETAGLTLISLFVAHKLPPTEQIAHFIRVPMWAALFLLHWFALKGIFAELPHVHPTCKWLMTVPIALIFAACTGMVISLMVTTASDIEVCAMAAERSCSTDDGCWRGPLLDRICADPLLA